MKTQARFSILERIFTFQENVGVTMIPLKIQTLDKTSLYEKFQFSKKLIHTTHKVIIPKTQNKVCCSLRVNALF